MPWSNSLKLYFARQASAYHKNRLRALQMPPVLAWEGSEIVLAGSNFARLIYDRSDAVEQKTVLVLNL
jgi:hypothetical protein